MTRTQIKGIADEMIDSTWTPAATFVNWQYGSTSHTYNQGTTYTGVAYTQANPQDNWAEFYTSLQTGVADGQMNPIPIVKFAKFDEVQKYLTLTNHLFTPYVWIMNKGFFDGLSASEKEVVKAAAESAIVACRGINRIIEASERGLPALAQKMQIYTPTKAEIAKFRELAQPAVKAQIAKSFGKEGEAMLADFQAAIDKASK